MSQKDDSENDIWDYRPLQKKKKKRHASPSETTLIKRKCTAGTISKKKKDICPSDKSRDNDAEAAAGSSGDCVRVASVEGCGNLEATDLPSPANDDADEGQSSGDFCPICQMPFYILVVQSQRWHVAECLDTNRDQCKECPDGLQCSSTIPNHYKKFNHSLLAHSRANSDAALLGSPRRAETGLRRPPGSMNLKEEAAGGGGGYVLESSQDSAVSLSDISTHSVSPPDDHNLTPKSKVTNGLLKLRSPAPEDFKKKKGWSSNSKSQKALTASQESKKEISSTPVKEHSGGLPSPKNCDEISYSPLSEFPADTEDNNNECRKALFDSDAFENKDEDSMVLFSDSFSSDDEVLAEFIDSNLEADNAPEKEASSSNTQLCSVSSLAPTNQSAALAFSQNRADRSGEQATCKSNEIGTTSFQSPQRIVLERLRETLNSENFNSSSIQTQQLPTTTTPPPSQNFTGPRSQSMAPRKGHGKAGQASGLKQTDIGVFFGLKPFKEKEKEEAEGEPTLGASANPAAGGTSGRRRQRGGGQGASKADAAAETGAGSGSAAGQVETGRGGSRGWRRSRWNRSNADGEVQLPRCPFYKKIPGTRFAVDAFHYGEIDGITAYFLTHFHSDHYGGLTRNSTLPIYCNRITGNLVKSKLKVAEQYVHVLPMNTEVTVEGVRVILLDANHCPGAAMLLFFLPDGQTVLHTGDFRADPSMETYPELLGCRVQTLYLDTTYCSPEYTFPRQQEVINYAASTAFELVTLSPRTLVVCGSYSVGKEKVFLALADVLGSKVCLSRDKYNTMCCLESKQIRERITTDWKAAQVHVLPMMQLNVKKLQDHLARFSGQYDQLVAFKPTGWTFSQQVESVEDIQPQISGNISIYGVPYSEHSSFLELKRFVQWLRPLKIIPTVNNGSWASRKAMEKCFGEWLRETRAKL